MKKVEIYADGACTRNPGIGGWGAILIRNRKKEEYSGAVENTTNNRMELFSAVKALEILEKPYQVELYSDSVYLISAFTDGWMDKWKSRRWRNADDRLISNIDLWQKLDELCNFHKITFIKVASDSDDENCKRASELSSKVVSEMKAKIGYREVNRISVEPKNEEKTEKKKKWKWFGRK